MLWWRVRVWLFQSIWAAWGLLGITGIERALTLVREQLDHPIQITGVLATALMVETILSEVHSSLKEHLHQLFSTVIPETVRLREAPSLVSRFFDHDPYGPGAKLWSASWWGNGMAAKAKPKVALGNNPLSQGIFRKTVESTLSLPIQMKQ